MKLCKCGCGAEISEDNNWEYKRGHKPAGGKKAAKKKPAKPKAEESEEVEVVTLSIDLTEEKLDAMWQRLDIGTKCVAMQYAMTVED